ncbi:MAG: hypothetical protein K940chlam8_00287 [Chlamydiae bacterium]|nr:hypothetical protein [Chlamydiota bacterium]
MSIVALSLTFFLLMDSFGNIPIYLSVLKPYPAHRQHVIIIREMLIALVIILIFQFLGEQALEALKISHAAIHIAGAVILFLIAVDMIFSKPTKTKYKQQEEPLIVPLAVPLVAGPAILASVIVFSQKENNVFFVSMALLIAWSLTALVLFCSTYIQKVLGNRVILAIEKMMGLVLTLFAVQMCMDGITIFIQEMP